jgi:hypothetical protein
MIGLSAFREAYLSAGVVESSEFGDWNARQLRYAIYWAYFQNDAYSKLHTWSTKFKADYGLYRYIRGIYNPAFRLASFWQAHLMGGALDAAAGDGKAKSSALPILIPDTNAQAEALRLALATLWRDSNWQVKKDVLTLRGSVFGDVGLRIVDDPDRAKVYLDLVSPDLIRDLTMDPFGNVKGYVLEDVRDDPRGTGNVDRDVTYREVCTRDGDNVHWQTFLDNTPFAWNGTAAEWDEPYGFVPFVFIKHNDIGLDWGLSELHAGRAKFSEADDIASKTSDQIRKLVDAPWLFAGVTKSVATPTATAGTPTTDKPQPGREEIPALYAPVGATATPLVAPLDLGNTLAHIKEILSEIERDYPELKADELRLSGALTGRALELAQQPATDKVLQRRVNYDNALVRAQQMAIAIGGYRGYGGYAGFDLGSFAAGALEHSIGERSVFTKSAGDQLEEDGLLWNAANAAVQAGVPLELFLLRHGWTQDDINAIYGTQPQQ